MADLYRNPLIPGVVVDAYGVPFPQRMDNAAPNPIGEPGCILWLSPESNYIMTATGVSGWYDRSNRCNANPAQSSSGQQPAYTTDTKVTFDGSNDVMTLSAPYGPIGATAATSQTPNNQDGISVGIKFALTATPGSGVIYSLITLGMMRIDLSTVDYFEILACNSAGYAKITTKGRIVSGNSVGFSPTLDTSTHRLIITYNGGTNTTTSNYTITYDGASQTVITSAAVARVDAYSSLGARQSGGGVTTLPAKLDLYKAVAFRGVLGSSAISRLDSYLT